MEIPTDIALDVLHQSYQQLFDRSPLPVLVYDLRTLRVLAANQAASQCYGYGASQWTNLNLADMCDPAEGEDVPATLRLPLAQWHGQRICRHRRCDGSTFCAEVDASDVEFGGAPARMVLLRNVVPTGVAAPASMDLADHGVGPDGCDQQLLFTTMQDATQRVCAEERRRVERVQLSQLTHKLMLQEQDLVVRVAQAMHDQLGQTLAATRMAHETLGVLRAGIESPELALLDQRLGTLIQQGIRQVRQVLVDLRPPMLEGDGLAAALDNDLRRRNRGMPGTPGVPVALDVQAGAQRVRWPRAVEYAAFMIAREAVDNALRHAQAALTRVVLSGTPRHLSLDIVDDGVGFVSWPIARGGHLGLAGMRERARAIGAALDVVPGSGCGTRVGLRWQETA